MSVNIETMSVEKIFCEGESYHSLPAQRRCVTEHRVEVGAHSPFVPDNASVCQLMDSQLGNTAPVCGMTHLLLGNTAQGLVGSPRSGRMIVAHRLRGCIKTQGARS